MKLDFSRLFALEQKMLGHSFVKKAVSFFAGPKGLLAVLALIAAVYSFRLPLHPGYHGDEMGLMSLPYRAVEYGDYKYPLIFSDTYNAGNIRLYPPIMAMKLRSLWHMTVGFSDYSSRAFSGLMMGTLALLFSWLALRRTHGDWRLSVAALVCAGLNPAVVVAARTVRFEQEIVFMGGLAFLLPLLFATATKRWLSRLVWTVSGLCAAWAGFSHPWGLIFPFVLVMSFLFLHTQWRGEDGLSWFGRISFFGLGCLLPFIETAAQILVNWGQFQDYLRSIDEFYMMRKNMMIEYFLNRYNIPLEPGIPGRIAAALLQLHMTGYAATATKLAGIDVLPIGFLFQIVFWGFIAAIAQYCFAAARRREAVVRLDVKTLVFLAFFFIVFGLLYVPNQVYALYAGLFVVIAGLFLRSACNCRYLALGVRAYTVLCIIFALSYLVFLAVSPKVNENIPLDERYLAFKEMNKEVGLKGGNIYGDTSTWFAAGKDMKAYTDIFFTGRMQPASAFIVDGETFNAQARSLGGLFGERRIAGQNWKDVFSREFAQNTLRGLIILEQRNTAYYYLMPTNRADPLLVTFYDKNGVKRQFRGLYKDMVPLQGVLSSGWHLLISPPVSPVDFDFLKGKPEVMSLRYARKGDWMTSVALTEVHKQARLEKVPPGVVVVPLLEGWGRQ